MFLAVVFLLSGVVQTSAITLVSDFSRLERANNTDTKAFANWTVFTDIVNEIEFEVSPEAGEHRVKNKLILLILEVSWLPGLLGIDRCYMGQTCVGVIKGVTLGGLSVWFVLDYVAVIITCLSFSPYINAMGMKAQFESHACTVAAFWVALLILIFKCCFGGTVGSRWAFLKGRTPEELSRIFKALDKNNDGELTKEELQQGLRQYGFSEKDINALLSQADEGKCKNGTVKYKDFVAFAAKQ